MDAFTLLGATAVDATPDADATTKGKLQLAGDLTGTAAAPAIATGAVTSAKIADGTIVNGDISGSAAIAASKVSGTALTAANNLSDVTAATARTNLGLGGAATLAVGTTAGTVAAGDDSRITGSYAASIPADRGYLAWSMAPGIASTNTVLPTAGTLYLARIRRVPAGSVTNIVAFVTVGGSSLTTGQCFATLFTAAGVPVGTTADQATAWASATVKTMALTGGPFTVAAGDYYAGFWFNGTTGPTLRTGVNASAASLNLGLSSPNLQACTANTGLTTTPPNPFGAQTSSVIDIWVALS